MSKIYQKSLTGRVRRRTRTLNVLIACEESQAECIAFRRLGHRAFSCDLQKARYHDEWHIRGDVTPYLEGATQFKTEEGKRPYLHPSWFGEKYTKKTLYWLRNLPPVMPTIEYANPKQYVHSSRGKYRSRTFPQVAEALATQWSAYILDELNKSNQ